MIEQEWTNQLRYRAYNEWPKEYIMELQKKVLNSSFRLNYHIQPNVGLLNDPNGFSYYNDEWHLFYQSFPMGTVHGLKSWFHLTSKDLVHWIDKGPALLPDNQYDSHGVYSGSALEVDGNLFIFYTGNVRTNDWKRIPYQNGSWMNKQNEVSKIQEPLIHKPIDYTEHFRDPMLFEYKGDLYTIIGAQADSLTGKILLYKAVNRDVYNWTLLSELNFTNEEMGYMIECPNLVFIKETPILIFCPQGLNREKHAYNNIYPNTYVIGESFIPEEGRLTSTGKLHNIDEGFDLYATQSFNSPDGRVLSIGWVGLPEISYPTDSEGWSHCLSLVKELTLDNGILYQYPVEETKKLRGSKISADLKYMIKAPQNNSFEIETVVDANRKINMVVFSDKKQEQGFKISVDTSAGIIIIDRSQSGIPFNEEFGYTRTIEIAKGKAVKMNIFADNSLIEIFLNNGQKTITSRLFPDETQKYIYSDQELTADIWPLERLNIN